MNQDYQIRKPGKIKLHINYKENGNLFELFYYYKTSIKDCIHMGSDQSTITYAQKQLYTGGTKENIPEGKGKLIFKNGAILEGQFSKG